MKVWREGGCHCGAVRFQAQGDFTQALECNCSICRMKGFLHVIVTAAEFRLLSGKESLESYQFGTRTAKHLFCRVCGLSSFYVPRSHPDGFSVNLRCVDGVDWATVKLSPFDGKNWEAARAKIR